MPSIPRSVGPAGVMRVRKLLPVGGVVVALLVALGAAWAVHRVTTRRPQAATAPLPPVQTLTQSRKAILSGEPRSYDQIPKPKPQPALPPIGIPVTRVEAATRPVETPRPERREAKVDPVPTPPGPSQAEIDARIRAAVAERLLQMREEQARDLQAQLTVERARQGTPPVPGQPLQGQRGGATASPADQRKKGWRLGDDDGAVLKGPYGETTKPDGEAEAPQAKSGLLKKAEWLTPADPTKVLYRTQVLRAVTLTRLSSDTPQSDARLLITSDVWDRWHRRVLIPQQSVLVGVSQAGRPTPGERRVTATIAELHFPDGTILDMAQSKLNDREGQAGLTGAVDNHLPQVGLAILINSALNVFARGAAGSPSSFQENLPQQYAAQAGQATNESAKEVVRQQLQRPPTILIEAGEPVTITLQGNVNLAHPPTIVR